MGILSLLLLLLAGTWRKGATETGRLGAPCNSDPRKPPCSIPNTFCINNLCTCAPLYESVADRCILRTSKSLGKRCNASSQCSGRGEYCNGEGRCSCLSTHLLLGGKCKPVIYPGQSGCEDSRQCAKGYPGATCNARNRCQCPSEFEAKAFSCFKIKNVKRKNNGTGEKRYAPGRSQLRLFRATFHDYNDFTPLAKHRDLVDIPPGEVCMADQDCSGYPLAYCDGRCQCSENAINTGNTCSSHKSAKFYESYNVPDSSTKPSCPSGQTYVQETGGCMITQKPGEPCQYSQQCEANESGSLCKNLRCHCPQGMKLIENECSFENRKCTVRGYVWVSEVGECMKVLWPGANGCSHSVQCSAAFAGSYCYRHACTCPAGLVATDGTCGKQCQIGFTFSSVAGQCIPTVKAGGQCQYTSQCQTQNAEMICDRNICRCSAGRVFTGNTCAGSCPAGFMVARDGTCKQGCSSTQIEQDGECYEQVAAGQNCRINAQCMGGSSCVNGICTCSASMTFRGGSCRQKEVPPQGSCAEGEVCSGGSYCLAGTCTCPSSSFPLHGTCVHYHIVPPNAPCNATARCAGGSICVANICQCPSGQQAIDEFCKVPAAVKAGGACPTGIERCSGGSSCVLGTCQCPFGTSPESGECVSIQKVAAGSPCSSTKICVGLASCIEGICRCPPGMLIQDGLCRNSKLVGPGASCAAGEICTGGSVCTKSICLCPSGTVNQNGICSAPQEKKAKEKCLNGEECSGDLICIDGTCRCPEGTVSGADQCIPVTETLGECSESSQCIGGSYCDHESGLCICPGGHELRDSFCVPTFVRTLTSNKRCISNVDCPAGTKCIANRCHCRAGEIFVGGRCQMLFAEAGESCSDGASCVSNFVCIDGICSCPSGEISKNGQCAFESIEMKKHLGNRANPNSPCSRGEICIGGSYCDVKYGLCRCPLGSVLKNGKCEFVDDFLSFTLPPLLVLNKTSDVPNKSFNDTMFNMNRLTLRTNRCESNDDCKGGSNCLGRRCICPFNMIMKDGLCQRMFPFSRERVGHLGGRCTLNHTCIARNTACQNGVCVCIPGHRIFGSTECIPKTAPFFMTSPRAAITTAPVSSSNENRVISEIAELVTNEALSSEVEIVPEDTSITSVMFTVSPLTDTAAERVSSGRQTEIIVNVSGGVCNETTLCLFFSICHNGVCRCPLGTRISETECKFVADVSRLRQFEKLLRGGYLGLAYATRSSAAASGHTSQATSSPSTTLSLPPSATSPVPKRTTLEWFWSTEEPWLTLRPRIEPKTFPVSAANISPPGTYCDDEEYYCSNGSVCIENQCVCKPGYVLLDGVCISQIYVRRCTISQQCPSGARCVDGLCSCIPGTAMSRYGFCIPVNSESGPGMPCTNGETCSGYSDCVRGICTCPPNRRYIVDNECVKSIPGYRFKREIKANNIGARTIPLGDPCTKQQPNHCAGGGMCIHNICKCPSGRSQQGKQCVDNDQGTINNGCTDDPTVCRDGTYCLKGNCVCPVGQICNPSQSDEHQRHMGYSMDNVNLQEAQSVSPGGPCDENDVRMQCTGNSVCANGFCTCPNGERVIDGICTAIDSQGAPGDVCQIGYTVCTGGSLCVDNHCKCLPNQVAINGQCTVQYRQALPNQACLGKIVCVGGAVCVQGTCVCPAGMHASLGSPFCRSTAVFHSDAIALRAPGERCITLYGQSPCRGGAICVNQFCVCRQGYVISRGICVPIVNTAHSSSGSTCRGVVCGGGSVCIEGSCRCAPGTMLISGQCLSNIHALAGQLKTMEIVRTSAPGERCSSNSRTGPVCSDDAICVNELCVCPADRVTAGNKCVRFRGHAAAGAPCLMEGIICSGGSMCISGICQCPIGTTASNGQCVISPSSRQLTPILGPGSRCIPLCSTCAQCGGGSVCLEGLCTCPLGQFPFRSRCHSLRAPNVMGLRDDERLTAVTDTKAASVVMARPGDSCNSTAICSGGSSCIVGKCLCSPGYVPNEERNSCINVLLNPLGAASMSSNPGESCTSLSSCTGGSSCLAGICTCPANSYLLNNECINRDLPKKLYTGSACAVTDICEQGSICYRGYCVCLGNTVPDQAGQCVQMQLSSQLNGLVGSRCGTSSNEQCAPSLECTSWGYCVCPSGYEGNGAGGCFQAQKPFPNVYFKKMSARCKTSEECEIGKACISGSCRCPAGALLKDNRCIYESVAQRTVQERTKCSAKTDCKPSFICEQGSCICAQGMHQTESGSACVETKKLVTPGSWCDVDSGTICSGGSRCFRNACVCPQGHLISALQSGLEIPGGLSADDVPQMILLTFDGPITDSIFAIYQSLFSGKYRNPNGCPIKATFFVSNERNNYDQTGWLISNGHEVAVNSMSHQNLGDETVERWKKEMTGMRDALRYFSYANAEEVIGVRAPQLELGGDNQFAMMESSGFLFDNSMSASGGPYWPQTLAYETAWTCKSKKCPLRSHPNVWEIPINHFAVPGSQKEFTMLKEAVRRDDSPLDVAEMLEMNLNRSYNNNKAPYLLTADYEFFNALPNKGAAIALELFIEKKAGHLDQNCSGQLWSDSYIDESTVEVASTGLSQLTVLRNSDVYFVTAKGALEWIRRPTRLLNIHNFEPWQCTTVSNKGSLRPCEKPSSCSFTCNGEVRVLRVCGTCPRVYPTLGDPTGTGNSTVDRRRF